MRVGPMIAGRDTGVLIGVTAIKVAVIVGRVDVDAVLSVGVGATEAVTIKEAPEVTDKFQRCCSTWS